MKWPILDITNVADDGRKSEQNKDKDDDEKEKSDAPKEVVKKDGEEAKKDGEEAKEAKEAPSIDAEDAVPKKEVSKNEFILRTKYP